MRVRVEAIADPEPRDRPRRNVDRRRPPELLELVVRERREPGRITDQQVELDDVRQLLTPRAAKLEGAITGKALYDGRLDPADAIALIRTARAA